MEKLESVINWIWNVAKTTEKALINEKYIVEYKYFKGKLPKRMTDAEDIAATKKEREEGKKLRYDNGGKFPKGLKKSKDDNKKMVEMDGLKEKRRKLIPVLTKKGSNRKMR